MLSSIAASLLKHIATAVGLRYKFENLERIQKDKPVVVISNHQSMIDVLGDINFFLLLNYFSNVIMNYVFAGFYREMIISQKAEKNLFITLIYRNI